MMRLAGSFSDLKSLSTPSPVSASSIRPVGTADVNHAVAADSITPGKPDKDSPQSSSDSAMRGAPKPEEDRSNVGFVDVLEHELFSVYPSYVDLGQIEAAVRGEADDLRHQLERLRANKE